MTERNPEPTHRQLLILLAGIVVALGLLVWCIFALVDVAITKIPVSVEQKLGALVVPIYQRENQDSPQQASLNQLLDRLEVHLEDRTRDYRVLYVKEDTVNAIAIPGDVILIFQGLVQNVQSENELMMILGHELGHFAHRDHLRRLGRILALRFAITALFGNLDWLNNVSTLAATISNAQYSQSQETQADGFGLTLLYQTYGHVAGATDFFQRLSEKSHQNWDFLATHPAPQKRVITLEKEIQKRGYPVQQKQTLPPSLQIAH